MDISLSPDNERYIQNQVTAGIYHTINEAINAAIDAAIRKTVISEKRIEEFNKEIEVGLSAYKNGDFLDGNIVMEELRKKYAS